MGLGLSFTLVDYRASTSWLWGRKQMCTRHPSKVLSFWFVGHQSEQSLDDRSLQPCMTVTVGSQTQNGI
jgi:hypothetical protein